MTTQTPPAADRIRREARVVGLRGLQIPTLEAVERRRFQLWIVTAVLLVSLAVAAVTFSLWPSASVRSLVKPLVLREALLLLSIAFCCYVVEKEIPMRRLSHLLVDERVLTAALDGRLREVSLILDASKALNSILELPDVLETILRGAIELLGGRSGSIMLLEGDELFSACVQGNDGAKGRRLRVGEGIAGRVAETREPLLITGTVDEARVPGRVERAQAVECAMSVPLVGRDVLLGVLNVNAAARDFSEYDLRAISLFAEQAAGAIGNANLYAAERCHVEELVELDRMKSEFIALVSHELRTPLASILAASETAQRPGFEDKQLDLAVMIERQALRLSGMVEELLSAAKLERDAAVMLLEHVDLAAVVRTAAKDAGVAGRCVSVEAPPSVFVLSEADALRRIVDNLIDNAFKYGAPPVRVAVEQRGGDVLLSVLDAGAGIPPTDRERIFDKFQRLQGGRGLPGLGLGLSIVRGLVTACGGEIRVEDAPGGGAAIRVRLHAAESVMKEAV